MCLTCYPNFFSTKWAEHQVLSGSITPFIDTVCFSLLWMHIFSFLSDSKLNPSRWFLFHFSSTSSSPLRLLATHFSMIFYCLIFLFLYRPLPLHYSFLASTTGILQFWVQNFLQHHHYSTSRNYVLPKQ